MARIPIAPGGGEQPPNMFTPSGRILALLDPLPPWAASPPALSYHSQTFFIEQPQSARTQNEHQHTITLEQEQNAEPYLIGNISAGFTNGTVLEEGHILTVPYVAPSGAKLTALVFRTGTGVNTATSVRMGVFADDGAGKPTGPALAEGVFSTKPGQNVWIEVKGLNLKLTEGTTYHFAVLPIGGNLHYNRANAGGALVESTTGGHAKLEEAAWETNTHGPIGFYAKSAKLEKPLGVNWEKKFELEQLQKAAVVKKVNKNVSATQGQTTTMTFESGRFLIISQGQTTTVKKALARALPLVTQSQTPTMRKTVGVNRSISQTQAVELSIVVTPGGRSFELTQTQSATRQTSLGLHFALTQGQSESSAKEVGKRLSVTQGQIATVTTGLSRVKTLTIEQAQVVTRAVAISRTLKVAQAKVVTLVKNIGRILQVPKKDGTKATVTYRKEPLLVLEVGQPQAITKRVSISRTLRITQLDSAHLTRPHALSCANTQATTVTKNIGKIMPTVGQGTVTYFRAIEKVLRALPQPQVVSMHRTVAITLRGTATQHAVLVRILFPLLAKGSEGSPGASASTGSYGAAGTTGGFGGGASVASPGATGTVEDAAHATTGVLP